MKRLPLSEVTGTVEPGQPLKAPSERAAMWERIGLAWELAVGNVI